MTKFIRKADFLLCEMILPTTKSILCYIGTVLLAAGVLFIAAILI